MQNKSKASRRKVIVKIRAEINKIKGRKIEKKIISAKSWFVLKKINKIEKPLARLQSREIRKKATNIKNATGDITTDITNDLADIKKDNGNTTNIPTHINLATWMRQTTFIHTKIQITTFEKFYNY